MDGGPITYRDFMNAFNMCKCSEKHSVSRANIDKVVLAGCPTMVTFSTENFSRSFHKNYGKLSETLKLEN